MRHLFATLLSVLLLGGAAAFGQNYGAPGNYGGGAPGAYGAYGGGAGAYGAQGQQSAYPQGAVAQDSASDISRLPAVETPGTVYGIPTQSGGPPQPIPGQGPGPPPGQGGPAGTLPTRAGIVWSVQADAVVLTRTGSSEFLGQTSVLGVGPAVATLNSNDTAFNLAPGMRIALSATVNDTVNYEILYFGLQNWSASNSILADPIQGTLATSPYTQTDKLTGGFDQSLGYSYKSSLQNAEFNVRRLFQTPNWNLAPLVGFRYFQWNETLSLTGVDQFYGVTENLNSTTNNYLVGGQVGASARRDWQKFSFGTTFKAGLFANFMQINESNLNSTGTANLPGTGFVSMNNNSRHTGVAGIVDFSLIGSYRVTQHFAVRGGYQLLYVTGLALAPTQFAGYSHNGGVLLEGPTCGLEFTW